VSERAKVAHLPLAEALKAYAGARDAGKLKALPATAMICCANVPVDSR
jgi:hypothetical protein